MSAAKSYVSDQSVELLRECGTRQLVAGAPPAGRAGLSGRAGLEGGQGGRDE